MNKYYYYYADGNILMFDNDKLVSLKRNYLSYKNLSILPEDGILNGKEVHKGDIVMTFYDNNFVVISKDSEFAIIVVERIKEREIRESKCCDEASPCDCNADIKAE